MTRFFALWRLQVLKRENAGLLRWHKDASLLCNKKWSLFFANRGILQGSLGSRWRLDPINLWESPFSVSIGGFNKKKKMGVGHGENLKHIDSSRLESQGNWWYFEETAENVQPCILFLAAQRINKTILKTLRGTAAFSFSAKGPHSEFNSFKLPKSKILSQVLYIPLNVWNWAIFEVSFH